ncbi:MAG: sulfite exporter TauE/SafE family protein [Candidatus Eiseniibacteriota bacterium]
MNPFQATGLALLGLVVGTLGTLIGAGGGFLLLPILIFLYPRDSPAVLTATSLSVVFFNASSGTAAYLRMRRVDLRAGIVFALAGLPGSILGVFVTQHLARRQFNLLLGVLLVLAGLRILVAPGRASRYQPNLAGSRQLVERDGTIHVYSPRIWPGALASTVVGFISSMLGIGGGIIHVPLMVYLLGFPTHVATATSHFVLAVLSLAGVLVHLGDGSLRPAAARIVPLAAGVLIGAQVGARISSRVHGVWIMRSLAVALLMVGLRLWFAP